MFIYKKVIEIIDKIDYDFSLANHFKSCEIFFNEASPMSVKVANK